MNRNTVTLIGLSLILTVTSSYGALLEGHMINVGREHGPSPQNPTALVGELVLAGPGVELTDFGAHPPTNLPGLYNIDLEDTRITIVAAIDQTPVGLELLSFIDVLHELPEITQVTVNPATNWTGFNYDFSFSDNAIFVGLAGASARAGERIILDLVPEPGSATLAGLGLIARATTRRLRLAENSGG